MSVNIQVAGIASTQALLSMKSKEASTRANEAIIKAGFFIEGEVVQSIAGKRAETRSVDTGRFMGSVKSAQKQPLTATIESNVEYAEHLEYGTSRMKPRSHFRNTAKRNEKKVQDFIEAELKKL